MSDCSLDYSSGKLELPTSCVSLDGQDGCQDCCEEAVGNCIANGELTGFDPYYAPDGCRAACLAPSTTTMYTGTDIYEATCRMNYPRNQDVLDCCTRMCQQFGSDTNCINDCFETSNLDLPTTTDTTTTDTTTTDTTTTDTTTDDTTTDTTTDDTTTLTEWSDSVKETFLSEFTDMLNIIMNNDEVSTLTATCIVDKITTDYTPAEFVSAVNNLTTDEQYVNFFLGDLTSEEPNGYLGECIVELGLDGDTEDTVTNVDPTTASALSSMAAMTANELANDTTSKSSNNIIIAVIAIALILGLLYLAKVKGLF